MIGFLVVVITGLIRLLISVLPVSPFQGITLGEAYSTALGWLNWVFPVGECARIFGVWLSAALIFGVVSVIIRRATGVLGVAGGGN